MLMRGLTGNVHTESDCSHQWKSLHSLIECAQLLSQFLIEIVTDHATGVHEEGILTCVYEERHLKNLS